MNFEKKYKDALANARQEYNTTENVERKQWLEELFPELVESEDERIRKEIISALKYANHEGVYNKHLAWLEKQGEYKSVDDIQKPTYMVEPRFKVGDYIKHDKANIICKVVSVNSGSYYVENIETSGRIELFNAEQNFHLWTIQDAKDGDVLYSSDSNQPFIYKCRNDGEQATCYCGINKFGKFFIWNTKDCIITLDKYVPATKKKRDLLFQRMKEAGYEWDAEKKDLREIERKITESEGKKIRKAIIKFLIDVNNGAYTKSELEIASWIAWLEKQGEQMKTPEESLDISSDKWNDIVDRCLFD